MKKLMALLLLCAMVLGLCGCFEELLPEHDNGPQAPGRMVVGITVTADASQYFSRHYYQQESMNRVLKYLRELKRSSQLKGDPEKALGTVYRFELEYADGTTKTYMQMANWYLKEGDKAWEQLVDADISELMELLEMPGEQRPES